MFTKKLDVWALYIKAALREKVVRSYPELNINSRGPSSIFDTRRCLVYYRSELGAYASMLQD